MAVSLEVQGDSDAHPARTEDQVAKYCLKYVSKVSKDDGIRDGETANNHRAKDILGDKFVEDVLGARMFQVFVAEIGNEVARSEVAHHAKRCPEFFCSRVLKRVYKAVSAVDTETRAALASDALGDEIMADVSDVGDSGGRIQCHRAPCGGQA